MKFPTPLLFLLLLPCAARADLGETIAVMENRYNYSTTDVPKGIAQHSYRIDSSNELIIAIFIDGICEREEIIREKFPFVEADIPKLLRNNGGGGRWIRTDRDGGVRPGKAGSYAWTLEGGDRFAIIAPDLKSVVFETKKYRAAKAAGAK